METSVSDAELMSYVDETLPVERCAIIEEALRSSAELRARAAAVVQRRDQGEHSLGEIWRRLRLSCPSRSELGSYLLNVADEESVRYIAFHLNVVGCRYCEANLEDLKASEAFAPTSPPPRRQRIFESSAGLLRRRRDS